MVKRGPAKKLTIYVDESDKHGGKPVYEAVLDVLYTRKIAGASVFRGMAGYGSDGVLHTAKMLALSTDLPVKIEAIDSEEMLDAAMPEITTIVKNGLIEVSDTNVVLCCTRSEAQDE